MGHDAVRHRKVPLLREEIAVVIAALVPRGTEPVTGLASAACRHGETILGANAVAWAVQVAGDLAARAQAERPGGAVPVHDIAVQGEVLVLQILSTLAATDDVGGSVDMAAIAEEQIRALIAVGAPFERVAETIRIAHEVVVRELLGVAIAREVSAATLTAITVSVARATDEVLASLAKRYVQEAERFSSSVQHARHELIDALLDGRPVDEHAVARILRVSIDNYHRSFVISGSPSYPHVDVRSLRRAADAIKNRLGARTIVVRENPNSLWAWVSADRRLPADESVVAASIGDEVRVGFGSMQSKAAGFRRTHMEAEAAARYGHSTAAPVVDYARHTLPVLLSADTERARWFVESELGELAAQNPRSRELVATLRCYFDSKLRIAVAAERLHVHRNTAIHRLAALETILGHPVTERLAEVQAALSLLDIIGNPPDETP
ncbi:CdaR family transcriptional regulator [Rhodococcus sp. I2R]|uniref:PucR family transcriptional regulator n=1 Tax=Rhodococcus sp. I2R TaxID=2855445 RepID=UPI001E3C60F6|nr:helix-turn-helix domain-containing protein [Rhodococcus sp. I2R]MCC8929771.1 helix-turn-helix domain-containing protein [Rhodococcus sp. I2R]